MDNISSLRSIIAYFTAGHDAEQVILHLRLGPGWLLLILTILFFLVSVLCEVEVLQKGLGDAEIEAAINQYQLIDHIPIPRRQLRLLRSTRLRHYDARGRSDRPVFGLHAVHLVVNLRESLEFLPIILRCVLFFKKGIQEGLNMH